MSKQRKVFKLRMEPAALQSAELLRMAGTARFIWNWALDRRQALYKESHKRIPQGQLRNELTILKDKQRWFYDFDFRSLFKHKKSPKQLFRIPQRVVLNHGNVYIPKLGWLKVRQSQDIEGDGKSPTFTGKWFVTLVTEFDLPECKVPVIAQPVIGGDPGLGTSPCQTVLR